MRVLAFLGRRLGIFAISLLGASLLAFAVCSALPGGVAEAILGEGATQAQIDALTAELGLNRPWPVRYLEWATGMLHGDFGRSYFTGQGVLELPAGAKALLLDEREFGNAVACGHAPRRHVFSQDHALGGAVRPRAHVTQFPGMRGQPFEKGGQEDAEVGFERLFARPISETHVFHGEDGAGAAGGHDSQLTLAGAFRPLDDAEGVRLEGRGVAAQLRRQGRLERSGRFREKRPGHQDGDAMGGCGRPARAAEATGAKPQARTNWP